MFLGLGRVFPQEWTPTGQEMDKNRGTERCPELAASYPPFLGERCAINVHLVRWSTGVLVTRLHGRVCLPLVTPFRLLVSGIDRWLPLPEPISDRWRHRVHIGDATVQAGSTWSAAGLLPSVRRRQVSDIRVSTTYRLTSFMDCSILHTAVV